ncbi:hypothetical protein BDY21DRAFT_408479 [Lineolata rhizophorae]|uniref:Methyltransferase domain-containing protein n=1 Tax=Lineolata rhizophorae TaxID=578093 RepID=A0A6A6NKL6_9PEZI|nr:hypothetical protein BDY21DRAFT_408479 [Lineolata rhizophorae]
MPVAWDKVPLADAQQLQPDRNVAWYKKDLDEVPPAARELLEKYSGIPPDKVKSHVMEIRDKAFAITPFPCIGRFHFLDLSIHTLPAYPEILARARAGQTVLDIGCCFGQDLRKLAFDGAPTTHLHGHDLRPAFWALGHALFRDGPGDTTTAAGTAAADNPHPPRFAATFSAGDFLDPAARPRDRAAAAAGVDVALASSFLHLFGWDGQVEAGVGIAGVVREGGLVVGRQVGNKAAGEYARLGGGGSTWRHNEESFRRLWDVVGERTGSRWEVVEFGIADGAFSVVDGAGWEHPGMVMNTFTGLGSTESETRLGVYIHSRKWRGEIARESASQVAIGMRMEIGAELIEAQEGCDYNGLSGVYVYANF